MTPNMTEEARHHHHQYHAHFDCFSGAAGDMLLASLLDAADSLPYPLPRLEAGDANNEVCETKQSQKMLRQITYDLENGLPELKGEFALSVERVWRGSGRIAANKLNVMSIYEHEAAPVPGSSHRNHDHNHHHHSHDHNHHHNHHHNHDHSHDHNHPSEVESKEREEPKESSLHHNHHHSHHHAPESHHSHSHNHTHQGEDTETDHTHNKLRNLPQIVQMLKAAPSKYIPSTVASLAVEAFTALAHAEMHTHGAESIDQVHFHEVGAVDSIVDTVGTLLALHYLSVGLGNGDGRNCKITCSRLPIGEGTVWTDHGLLPVPAPATLRLMIGMPTCPGPAGVTGELVTPTAAALLRVLTGANNQAEQTHSNYWQPKSQPGRPSSMIPRAVGLGAGTKDFERHPNVLRLILGDCTTQEQADVQIDLNEGLASTTTLTSNEEKPNNHIEKVSANASESEEVISSELKNKDEESSQPWNNDILTHLEANIDDATPELLAYAIDLLLENDAIDGWVGHIVMKKGRPAHSLNCLCHADTKTENNLLSIMFQNTTTLGIRIHRNILRASLERSFIQVQLPYRDNSRDGVVDMKVSSLKNGKVVSIKAEFDQCKVIAKESNVPLKIVSSTADRLAWQLM